MQAYKKRGFWLGLILFFSIILSPHPTSIPVAGWYVLASAVLMAVWWGTEAIPLPITALLPLILFPSFNIGSFQEIASPYANQNIYLFLGGFILALAIESSNLHRRLALNILCRVGLTGANLVAAFMFISAMISMWIINTATTLMLLPIALAISKSVLEMVTESNTTNKKNFEIALLLGIAYAATIGGMATLVGTAPNIIFAGFMQETYNIQISFFDWMKIGLPISLVMLITAWFILTHLIYPIKIKLDTQLREKLKQMLQAQGKMTADEKKVLIIFLFTASAWIFRNRINQGLKTQSNIRKILFQKTVELGSKRYEDPSSLSLWDRLVDVLCERLVRKKIRERFGGRLKALVSGGAPLNYDVGLFFTALGVRILQGFGQTESSPVACANPPSKIKLHTVGPPLRGVEIKIAKDGEILIRGELVMKGYWNDPDATIAAISDDNWLHTGDIGHIDNDGYIVITDRKKDIIVNSGGDNISPQRVEGILSLEEEIEQVMVFGDKRPYLTAVIVPDDDWRKKWATANGKPQDLDDLAKDKDFAAAIGAAVSRSNETMPVIEKVRKFIVAPHPFTVENGQMTPTLKVRRHAVMREYREDLEKLY